MRIENKKNENQLGLLCRVCQIFLIVFSYEFKNLQIWQNFYKGILNFIINSLELIDLNENKLYFTFNSDALIFYIPQTLL